MITKTILKKEIEDVEDLISDMEEEIKHEKDLEAFHYIFKKIERYRHYLKAFKMCLNGFEYETGSY